MNIFPPNVVIFCGRKAILVKFNRSIEERKVMTLEIGILLVFIRAESGICKKLKTMMS